MLVVNEKRKKNIPWGQNDVNALFCPLTLWRWKVGMGCVGCQLLWLALWNLEADKKINKIKK